MPFTDGKTYCPDCGREMLPLSQSFYCPNDCDRKPSEVQDEITKPTRCSVNLLCPNCGSPDIVDHSVYYWKGWKCIDCRHTWS